MVIAIWDDLRAAEVGIPYKKGTSYERLHIFLEVFNRVKFFKKGKTVYRLLHNGFRLLLEEVQTLLDIFHVLSARQDDLS